MNCATHSDTAAVAFCRSCGKPLCNQCTRDVRGVIYCESCLAAAWKEPRRRQDLRRSGKRRTHRLASRHTPLSVRPLECRVRRRVLVRIRPLRESSPDFSRSAWGLFTARNTPRDWRTW